MPCDSVRMVTMDLENIVSEDVLLRGLETAGFTVRQYGGTITAYRDYKTITIANGKATVQQGSEGLVAEVKQAYAKEAWQTAARSFGGSAWKLTQDVNNPNHLSMKPRY
jgi:hypothetical protein